MNIDKEKVITAVKKGADFVLETSRQAFDEETEKVYTLGIEEGIKRSIWMLLDLNIKENDVINELNRIWDIPASEARDRIQYEKASLAAKNLGDYLRNLGYSNEDIELYIREKHVMVELRRKKELIVNYDSPKKMKAYFDKK